MKPIISVEGLVDWLEKQPGETTYQYTDTRDCLLFRYIKSTGRPISSMGAISWREKGLFFMKDYSLPAKLNSISIDGESTYSAALARAKAVLKERGE